MFIANETMEPIHVYSGIFKLGTIEANRMRCFSLNPVRATRLIARNAWLQVRTEPFVPLDDDGGWVWRVSTNTAIAKTSLQPAGRCIR